MSCKESYFRSVHCTHLLYCSVLSLGGNVNTRRMSKPDMGSTFHIKKSMTYYENYQNYQNLMLLTSKDTIKRTLMHLFFNLVYKFRPKRTVFNVYAEYTRPQSTFLALHPCLYLYVLKQRTQIYKLTNLILSKLNLYIYEQKRNITLYRSSLDLKRIQY